MKNLIRCALNQKTLTVLVLIAWSVLHAVVCAGETIVTQIPIGDGTYLSGVAVNPVTNRIYYVAPSMTATFESGGIGKPCW